MSLLGTFLAVYGWFRLLESAVEWLWAKTHPEYRKYVFMTHHGYLFKPKVGGEYLANGPLLDALREHWSKETGKDWRK